METTLIKTLAFILLLCGLSACEFHIGTEWHGHTGVDNQTITPSFRGTNNGK